MTQKSIVVSNGVSMSNLKNLTGMTFNRLYVIKRVSNDKSERARWLLCRCKCGTIKTVLGKHLLSHKIQSCGCLQRERTTKHNKCHTRLYNIWRGMKDRCYNSNVLEYDNYGGRGIKVCEEWLNDFQAFYNWSMSHGYSDDLTIDRKENDGDYCPENCRWVTYKEQNNNTSRNRLLTNAGETHTISEWSEILGINASTISSRLSRGCSDVEALMTYKKVNQYD